LDTASWMIGDVKLTRIVEMKAERFPHWGFRNLSLEDVRAQAWMRPHFATEDGKLRSCIQSFVIETADRTIIVDTCVGNDKARQNESWNDLQTSFLDELAAAGYPPEGIDTVLCTHLHVDHVGWNTRLVDGNWIPTFANAKYLFGRFEWEHWSQEAGDKRNGEITPEVADDVMQQSVVNADSIQPVIDAGLHELVEPYHQICEGISLFPTPGHSPGHVSVSIKSGTEQAVITGDMMHSPIQCSLPHVASNFDYDTKQAEATRREFLSQHADGPVKVFGTHFRHPTWGRIVSNGDSWVFDVKDSDAC